MPRTGKREKQTVEMTSRSPKLFCNTSVSSLQWALVSTLFSHTHFRAFLAMMADVIKQIHNHTSPEDSQLPAGQCWLLPLQGLQGHHSLRISTRSRAGRGVQTLGSLPFPWREGSLQLQGQRRLGRIHLPS